MAGGLPARAAPSCTARSTPGRYEKDFAAQFAFLAAHARRLGPTGGSYRTAGWLASELSVQELE